MTFSRSRPFSRTTMRRIGVRPANADKFEFGMAASAAEGITGRIDFLRV
jgi:hypothetical protein